MRDNSKQPLTVQCPTCRKPVEWRDENTFRPFCSERCKMIDLGAWAAEDYRIPDRSGIPPLDEFDDDPTLQ